MIQHSHSLICVRPIIDQKTGAPSYIDIIEGVNLPKSDKGLRLPALNLMTRFWIRDGAEIGTGFEVEVSLIALDRKRRVLQVMKHEVDNKGENVLFHLEINNLSVEREGLYEFEVRWKADGGKRWKKGTIIPLKVSVNK